MSKIRLISGVALIAIVIASLTIVPACSQPAPAPTQAPTSAPTATPVKVKELTFNTYTPATHHVSVALTQFCKDVEKATNGEIKVTLYPGETLTKSAEVLDGLLKGISDFGYTVNSYNPGRLPLFEVMDLPLPNVKSCEQLSVLALNIYNKFQPKEYDGIKVLGFMNMALSGFNSNKPITKLEDIVGQQIRCTGGDVPIAKAFGATPVAMPITESYLAIQKGIVDGFLGDYAAQKAYKIGEVLKSHTEYFFRNTNAWFGMNQKTFNTLTPSQQKIMVDLGTQYTTLLGKSRDAEDKAGRDYLVGLGNKMITLTPAEITRWENVLKPFIDDYIKAKSALGLPAKEVIDFALAELKK